MKHGADSRMHVPYDREFYEKNKRGSSLAASRVVPELLRVLSPASVIDVGCGVGTWLAEFQRYGILDVIGVDGDYVDPGNLYIDPRQFYARDLRGPLEIGRDFDLAVCLEVAEHLPAECAELFVRELTHLAPAVFFSAAVPLQGGVGHLNEQWPDYWAKIFERFGFLALDFVRPRIWNDPKIDWWYRQNSILYFRGDYIEARPKVKRALEECRGNLLCLVHPQLYLGRHYQAVGLKTLLCQVPAALKRALKNRLYTGS
jgi:SAM-dependent methyltransferase